MNKRRQTLDMVLAVFFTSWLYYYIAGGEPRLYPELKDLYVGVLVVVALGLNAKVITRVVLDMVRDPKE